VCSPTAASFEGGEVLRDVVEVGHGVPRVGHGRTRQGCTAGMGEMSPRAGLPAPGTNVAGENLDSRPEPGLEQELEQGSEPTAPTLSQFGLKAPAQAPIRPGSLARDAPSRRRAENRNRAVTARNHLHLHRVEYAWLIPIDAGPRLVPRAHST
jgi:hypothetical protein